MSGKDWYARKLGQVQEPRRDPTPPTQFAPMPHQPQVAQPPIPHPTSPQYTAPQRFEQPHTPHWEDLSQDERRQFLLNNPKPGVGNRDAQHCPECGGTNLYSRRNQSGIQRGDVYAAPHCFDCGWPLVQSGSVGGALGAG